MNHSPSSDNNQDPTPPAPRPSLPTRFFRWLKRPSTLIGIGTLGGVLVGGGIATYAIARRELPSLIESQLTNVLDRPVTIGEFEELSLSTLRIGPSEMPATETDADRASIQEITIEYDLRALLTQWTLPVTVTLVEPNVYLDENEDGVWLDLDLEPPEEERQPLDLPFDVKATTKIEEAEIVLVPQALAEPVEIQAEVGGELAFPREGKQAFSYDIQATFAEAPVQIRGETDLENFRTQADIAIANLSLAKLSALLDELPVQLDQGQVNVDLAVNIPSIEAYQESVVTGQVEISNVTGRVTLSEDNIVELASDLRLDFQDQTVAITRGDITFGEIPITLSGQVNLEQGYDLGVAVAPFTVEQLLALAPQVELPVATQGEFSLDLDVTGAIEQPQLKAVLNATQPTQIDKIQLASTLVEVSANLDQIVLDRTEITPETGGKIIANGTVQTNLQQRLKAGEAIDLTAMPVDLTANIDLPLNDLAAAYVTLPADTRLGSFNSNLQLQGTAKKPDFQANWKLIDTVVSTIGQVLGQGQATFDGTQFLLTNTTLQTELGEITAFGSGNLETKNWNALINSNAVALNPVVSELIGQGKLNESIEALNVDIRASGALDALQGDKIGAEADVTLALGGRAIDVEGRLEQGILQALIRGQRLDLAPFIALFYPQLKVPIGVTQLEANLGGNITPLFNRNTDLVRAIEQLQARLNTVVAIDRSQVDLNANLARGGQVEADLFSNSPFRLTTLIPTLPVETFFEGGNVSLASTVAQLGRVIQTKDLGGVNAETALQLSVGEGAIALQGQLENGLWNANILASDINTNEISGPYLANLGEATTTLAFPPLNADFALSGEANPLLEGTRAGVNINRANVDWGKQSLQANGIATLANLFTAPDIAETALNLNANLDFNTIPTEEILNLIPLERQYLPESLEIAGESQFSGQVTGKQLLQAPTAPNSVVVTGDVNLTNFQFNDLIFDPVMAGTLNFATGDDIALNLNGENDALIANLNPCLEETCVAPYSLNRVQLRQQDETEEAIAVLATGQQNQIEATIENFPLSVFRIAPAGEFGFPGRVGGTVNAQANLDLDTVSAKGEVAIENPGVGTTKAEALAIAFSYGNNEASLSEGRLDIGDNRFNFEGNYNLASGDIGGNLTLEDGNIQDLLAAANLSTVQDLSRFTQPQNQGTASDIGTIALGNQVSSLSSSLALHQETVNQLQTRATTVRQSGLPDQLNLRGDLDLEANLAGNINNPTVNLTIAGNDWQARPRPSTPNVLPELGFVIEDSGVLPINDLAIAANYENGIGKLETATITFGGGTLSASGEFDGNELSGKATVEDLSLDTIFAVVPSPVDASGIIDAELALSGSPQNPALEGNFSFKEGSFQGQAITETFTGEFSYSDSRFALQTTNPEDIDIQVDGEIAFPPQPGFENKITADVAIGESGFALLGALSLGQIEWIEGQGQITLAAETAYTDDPAAAIDNFNLSGQITFEDAVVLTTALSEKVTINGQVAVSEDQLQIEELQGTVDESEIAIAGAFPFFAANPENPLVITLNQGDIDLENLYKGRADANVTIQGMATNPIIGGEVRLYEGQVFIPQRSQEAISPAYQRWFGDFAQLEGEPPVKVVLNDFRVVLDDGFRLASPPVYQFAMTGELTLNGSPLDIPSLRSAGAINLERGDITLFNTDFFLSRLNENQIVFVPSRPILNPDLDVEMGTSISDPRGIGRSTSPNEVRDDITRVGQSDTITVNLAVKGEAQDILTSLGSVSEADACQGNVEDFLTRSSAEQLSPNNLNREEKCLSQNVIRGDGTNQQLLESPAVQLTSSPSRSRGQIIELLAQQFIGLAEQLENSTGEELLQFGATEFFIEPLARDIIFLVNEEATKFAQPIIGVSQARVYPELEGIYHIGEDGFVGVGYDYTFGEFKVRYETFF